MKTNIKIQELTKISLCVAILCITSFLVIPIPFSPVVLGFQTVMINLIGLMFKPKEAGLTIFIYLMMGLIGLPVFSAGSGGPGKLFGPTGGFYFGFLVAVLLISLLKGKKISFVRYCVVTIVIGLPIQHMFAILFMCIHNGWNAEAAFLTMSLPFIVGDIVKCVMASTIGVALNRVLK
ncbi:MAG: biotin transporter BioY [Agathobacter sp.]|nr:biotin transporter BioY [Agathobacter sp.]